MTLRNPNLTLALALALALALTLTLTCPERRSMTLRNSSKSTTPSPFLSTMPIICVANSSPLTDSCDVRQARATPFKKETRAGARHGTPACLLWTVGPPSHLAPDLVLVQRAAVVHIQLCAARAAAVG